MAGVDIDAKLGQLQKKHALHLDVVDDLDARISWLLLGLIKAEEFNDLVRAIEGFPKEKMDAVIQDINENILGPIRGKYMELQRLSAQIEEPAEEKEEIKSETPEEVLRASGIEVFTETKSQAPATQIPKMTEEKLIGAFRLPKQETDLSIIKPARTIIEERPEELPSPGIMKKEEANQIKIDPYREKPL